MTDEFITTLLSPVGIIEIQGTDEYITSVKFKDEAIQSSSSVSNIVHQCKCELEEYFAGARRGFSVKLYPEGTDFRKSVWKELLNIAYGDTASYMDIAKKLKNPGAVRAVGLANNKNPIAIIIPCHRIIGEDGKLVGYGGGLPRKQWLLEHEGNISGKHPTLF